MHSKNKDGLKIKETWLLPLDQEVPLAKEFLSRSRPWPPAPHSWPQALSSTRLEKDQAIWLCEPRRMGPSHAARGVQVGQERLHSRPTPFVSGEH